MKPKVCLASQNKMNEGIQQILRRRRMEAAGPEANKRNEQRTDSQSFL